MDVTQVYVIVAGGLFAALTVLNFCLGLWRFTQTYGTLVLRYLVYPFFIHRHRLIGPWSRGGMLLRLLHLTVNVFCTGFKIGSIAEAAGRTGTLSLINMIPLFLGPHLSFLASTVGLSLKTFEAVHGSSAVVSVLLGATHTVLSLHSSPVSLKQSVCLYGLIGISSLAALLLFSPRCFHRPSYELFLRGHQGCAALTAYAMWRHIAKGSGFPGIYLYIMSGLFLSTTFMEAIATIYHNFTFRRGYSRASMNVVHGAIRMKIDIPRSWKVRGGQYVNIWFPNAGFRACVESHPFMIASWNTNTSLDGSDSQPMAIQLLIEPRDGFTRRLLRLAKENQSGPQHLVLYSGPYGLPASMEKYGSVLMIASGFGIAAQLSHIKELLDGYEACNVITRRIHLVWQLTYQGQEMVAKDLIDATLAKDSANYGWILQISIYYAGSHDSSIQLEGSHGRLAYHGGVFDPKEILKAEIDGDYPRYTNANQIYQATEYDSKESLKAEVNGEYDRYTKTHLERWTQRTRGEILVAVSANSGLRDAMRALVTEHIDQRVRYLELEYQP